MLKQFFFTLLLLSCSLALMAAGTFPAGFVKLPNVGAARIKVVGQNCENYFVNHLSHSNADATTPEAVEEKTAKIVSAFLYMDADIYAMVELEKADTTLAYLTAAMNAAAGGDIFAYVKDHIADCNSNDTQYGSIMAGFIYRKATVAPVGNDFALASGNTYGPRMRGQFFKELATDEVFLLAINHFKAQGDEQSQQTRISNASSMLTYINQKLSTDPDVLVMGDLNCETTETALQNILAAGYTEMLQYYDSKAYSYYYSGNTLIDHALANESMRPQVTGAGVFHVNTASRSYGSLHDNYHYSDHDAVMVGLALGDHPDVPSSVCDSMVFDFCNNLGGFTAVDLAGSASWASNATYGAQLSARSDSEDDWLISPEIDLSDYSAAELHFNHSIYYDNGTQGDYTDYQTLHLTTAYTGDPATTEWQQVVIPTYRVKTYVDASVTLPAEYLTSSFRFAFRTTSDDPSVNQGNYWEIKNARIVPTCKSVSDALTPETSVAHPQARKVLLNGRLLIITDNGIYDMMGVAQ